MKNNPPKTTNRTFRHILVMGLIVVTMFTFSCTAYKGLNMNAFKTNMSKQNVLNVLKKDSDLVYWTGLKTYGFCRADILEYGNWEKFQWRKSSKLRQKNPRYNKENDKMHYWFVFYNDSLKYIKYGNTREWNTDNEIDSLITAELRRQNSEKLNVVYKIQKIGKKK